MTCHIRWHRQIGFQWQIQIFKTFFDDLISSAERLWQITNKQHIFVLVCILTLIFKYIHQFLFNCYRSATVQFSSVAQSCLTLCNSMKCSTPGLPVRHQLPEFTQTHDHWVGDAIQPSHPLSCPSPAFHLSQCRVFSNESVLRIGWPKYCSFCFSISPSNEYSGLISFRMDCLISLQSKGILSLLQHYSPKASILQNSG